MAVVKKNKQMPRKKSEAKLPGEESPTNGDSCPDHNVSVSEKMNEFTSRPYEGDSQWAQALRASEERYRSLVEQSPDAIFINRNDRIVFLNPAGLQLFGARDSAQILGRSPFELFHPSYHPVMKARIKLLLEEQPVPLIEGRILKLDGSVREVEVTASPFHDQDGVAIQVILRDVTDRKRMEAEIKHQAHHDFLTDLPNRRLFIELLNLELANARRSKSMSAVLFLDLDKFKYVNDTLGHQIGDELLRVVAGQLRASVRESDVISRIGGDEFNVLLNNIARPEDILLVTKKILDSFKAPVFINGHEIHVTTSIGISICPTDADSVDSLFRNADIAMYHAKEQGGNTYQFYNPVMNIRTINRLRLEHWLRMAIDRDELEVYYQPQVSTDTKQIICAEALVRWRHPEQGMLEPKHFIPLAEEIGFITAIDEWVLRTACDQFKQWHDDGLLDMSVTVNLSAKQFQTADLVERIALILKETGLEPKFLDLEITESAAMKNLEYTIPNMNRLTEMGVEISIDDFGTGYSSLNYLKRLPIHKLKIDQSFVRDIATNSDDRTIVKAVAALAQNMKLRVIAEGVETEEQLEFLKSIGCREMQGFLFSRPLPAEKFRELLARETRTS